MENLSGKIYLDKKNPLSQSLTTTHFYLQQKKSESYPTIIQMLKSDLIQIQDMINSNSVLSTTKLLTASSNAVI